MVLMRSTVLLLSNFGMTHAKVWGKLWPYFKTKVNVRLKLQSQHWSPLVHGKMSRYVPNQPHNLLSRRSFLAVDNISCSSVPMSDEVR